VVISSIVFTTSDKWSDSIDALKAPKAVPRDSFDVLLGRRSLERVLDVLIRFAISPNEQLARKTRRRLRRLTTDENFSFVSLAVLRKIEYFNESELAPLLRLVTSLLARFPHRSTPYHVCTVGVFEVSGAIQPPFFRWASPLPCFQVGLCPRRRIAHPPRWGRISVFPRTLGHGTVYRYG
jgi:hypothetical protein